MLYYKYGLVEELPGSSGPTIVYLSGKTQTAAQGRAAFSLGVVSIQLAAASLFAGVGRLQPLLRAKMAASTTGAEVSSTRATLRTPFAGSLKGALQAKSGASLRLWFAGVAQGQTKGQSSPLLKAFFGAATRGASTARAAFSLGVMSVYLGAASVFVATGKIQPLLRAKMAASTSGISQGQGGLRSRISFAAAMIARGAGSAGISARTWFGAATRGAASGRATFSSGLILIQLAAASFFAATGRAKPFLTTRFGAATQAAATGQAGATLRAIFGAASRSAAQAQAGASLRAWFGGVTRGAASSAQSYLRLLVQFGAATAGQARGRLSPLLKTWLGARALGAAQGRFSGWGHAVVINLSAASTGVFHGVARFALFSSTAATNFVVARAKTLIATRGWNGFFAESPVRKYTAQGSSIMSLAPDLYPPIVAGEQLFAGFDYWKMLSSGVTISAVTSVTCAGENGIDSAASSRLLGTPIITPSPKTLVAAQAVKQIIGNMVPGERYFLQCIAATSDGQEVSIETHVDCVAVS